MVIRLIVSNTKILIKSAMLSLFSLILLSSSATFVMAEEVQTCVQTTQYGGAVGTVCGAHTPVETGLADINPVVLASVFFSLAGASLYKYKKLAKQEIAL